MPIVIALIIIGVIALIVAIFLIVRKNKAQGSPSREKSKDRNSIIREANKRLAQNPRDADALQSLADLHYREGDFDKALKNYNMLVDLVPTNPDLDEFEITLRYALCAMKMKQYDEAYKNFVIARTLKQDSFEVNYNLGYLEYMRKSYEKAASLLAVARRLNPDDVQTLRYLGHSLFKLKRYKDASAALRKTIEFEPDDKESLFAAGQCYYETGHHDQATKIFTHLRTDPDLGATAALFAGTIKLNNRQYEEAIMDFEIGLRHDNVKVSTRKEILYRLSTAYIQLQNIAKAVGLLQELHEEDPAYKDVAVQLSKYRELNSNKNLQTYLISTQSEFVNLCRRIAESYFKNARTKIIDISVFKNEYTDILAETNTSKWEDIIIYRFVRGNTQVGELVLRDLYSRLKDVKAGRGFCIASGEFTEGATAFVEARLIDLIDKKGLIKLLNSL